jgi:uncharacterized protein (TIGR03435 family)
MRRLTVLLLGLLAASVALAQAPPAFEVASVRPLGDHRDDHSTGMPAPITDPGQVNYPDVSLTGVLTRAYHVKPLQIVGPDWLRNDRFSIIAKAPADAPKGQIPAMLRTLLAQRFGLKVHWETRQEKGYSLVVGKMGAKLTKSAVSDEDAPLKRSSGFTSKGHLTWKASTLEDFAVSLTIFMGSPVVDMTEIPGIFDIAFDAAPDSMPGMPFHGPSGGDFLNPSINEAIRGLGLDLQSGKVSVKHLVVDSVQRVPTEN